MQNYRIGLLVLAAMAVAGAVPVDLPPAAAVPLGNDPVYAGLAQIDGAAPGTGDVGGSLLVAFAPDLDADTIIPATILDPGPTAEAVPVPEPRPLGLFGLGVLGIGALSRRRGRFSVDHHPRHAEAVGCHAE